MIFARARDGRRTRRLSKSALPCFRFSLGLAGLRFVAAASQLAAGTRRIIRRFRTPANGLGQRTGGGSVAIGSSRLSLGTSLARRSIASAMGVNGAIMSSSRRHALVPANAVGRVPLG